MAGITFLDEGDGGGDDEAPYLSHDVHVHVTDPDLPPPDLASAEIPATVEIFHRENQVNFFMDLFHQRVDQSQSPYPDFQLDLDLELGFCTENHDLDADDCDDVDGYGCRFASADCSDEFFDWRRDSRGEPGESSIQRRGSVISNLDEEIEVSGIDLNLTRRRDRVISDEEIEAMGNDLDPFFDEENENVGDDDRSSVQICWDSFRLEDQRDGGEDFEWEEIDGRVDEREMLSMFFDADVDDDLDLSVALEDELGTDQIMELELGIDQVRNLEWEVLLNIQNADSNADDEYEIFVGQFVGIEAQNPPASKAAVEGLTVVVVTKGDVGSEVSSCAICKDDMGIGEMSKILPCLHRYHGGCIDLWLGMRNTCPVCRFELPTNDPEYERRRVERERRVRA